MSTTLIKSIQTACGAVADGIWGAKTLAAVASTLGCSPSVKALQILLGVVADGVLGAKTLAAVAARLGIITIPTQKEVRSGGSIYGRPGCESDMLSFAPPYQMYYEGTPVKTIRCHKLAAASLQKALSEVLEHYGKEQIHQLGLDKYSGCYNYRATATGKALSMHAWGAAIDIDAEHNAYSTKSPKAGLSRPECQAFIDIMERNGWRSLGRRSNLDWMHFQRAEY